jgi:lipoprotein-releasing system permease protein
MYRWVIAWRWLKGLPILWISVVGVLLGVASILVVDSIFNGVLRDLKRVYRGSSSDLVVLTQVMPRRGAREFVPTDAIVRAILSVPGVAGAAPRLRRPAILPKEMRLPEVVAISAISRQSLLELVGVDPDRERSVSDFRRFLEQAASELRVPDFDRPFDVAGLEGAESNGGAEGAIPILLGERCAKALKLARGSKFQLLTLGDVDPGSAQQTGLQPRSSPFVVAGCFKTESFIEDLQRAYVPREELRKFAGMDAPSTEIAVKADPGSDDTKLVELQELLIARLEPFQLAFNKPVLRWEEMSSKTLAAIDNQRNVLDFMLFFIVLVAGFNLLVSLHLLVTEKIRDIGTLASLGGSAMGIASIIPALGILVTAIGAALGLAGGALLAFNINTLHDWIADWTGKRLWGADVYLFEKIPIDFEPKVIGLALLGTFGVTLFFAFLASLRAARLDPIEALRQE